MHPILGNRRRLAIYLLAWLLIGLLIATGLRGDRAFLTAVAFFLPVCLIFALVSLSSWYVCRVFPIVSRVRLARLLAVHMAVAALASAMSVSLAAGWATALDLAAKIDASRLFADQWPLLFSLGALLFGLATVFHYLLITFEASREAERRALELSLLAREAELKALRAQIDPHFIF